MVDHDSRKRVAKKYRHFFFFIKYHFFSRAPRSRALKFFLKFFLKNSSKIPPGDAAAAASNQQQPAATRNNPGICIYMYTQFFGKKRLLTL
jgi:hypothetical protein